MKLDRLKNDDGVGIILVLGISFIVIALIASKTQCSLMISLNVFSGSFFARVINHLCRNRGSAINSITVNRSHTITMACIHQYVAIRNRSQRSHTMVI